MAEIASPDNSATDPQRLDSSVAPREEETESDLANESWQGQPEAPPGDIEEGTAAVEEQTPPPAKVEEQDIGEAHEPAKEDFDWVEHAPIALFAIPMGVGGLALTWKKMAVLHDYSMWGSWSLLMAQTALFVLIAAIYMAKALNYPKAIFAEWKNPIRSNFYPAIPINIIIAVIVLEDEDGWVGTAKVFFHIGAILQLILGLVIMGRWLMEGVKAQNCNPICFIPAVGNLIVPVAGGKLGYTNAPWLFYAAGIIFWLVLFTSLVQRLISMGMIPAKLVPSLFIILAPPAIAQIAYTAMTETYDNFALIMTYFSAFLFLLLLRMGEVFVQNIKLGFQLTWWAYTFPLCAFSITLLEYHGKMKGKKIDVYYADVASYISAIIATVVLGLVSLSSLWAIAKRKFIVKE